MGHNHEFTILIIDDSLEDRESIKRLLSKSCEDTYLFFEADTGEEGFESSKKHKPDCILLDYKLPDINGIDFIENIANDHNLGDIPIILLTGQGSGIVAGNSLKSVAQDYLIKGNLDSEILMRSIRYAIGKKHAEKEVKRSKQYTENLIETVQDAIISIDENGIINIWNKSAEKIFGYSKSEIIGQPVTTIITEKYRKQHQEGLKRFLRTGEAKIIGKKVETSGKTKEGVEIPIELSLSFHKTEDNRYSFTALIRDITQRKRREEENYKLTCAIEQSPCTVVITDTRGIIEYVNPKFTELTGYTSEETIGQNASILKSDKTSMEVFKKLWDTITSGREWHGEFCNKKKNGELFWESASISPVRNTKGVIANFVAVNEDITVRKQFDEKLKQALVELKRSNTELEQLVYVASHDLQEPLRMVASYVQLLQRRYKDKIDDDANDFIAYAVDGAKRMQGLINDLLAYSRVGSRGKDFDPIDCETVIDRVVGNLEASIKGSGAVVTHDSMPTVMADSSQIVQLFQNLIGNAIKYRNEEIPRVHISAKENGKNMIFSVNDNGLGIDPQYYERIFTIFQRLHGKKEYSGTGIGLAICKKIVERHGGEIWVESQPGKGSTFYFTIPKKGAI